jgi:hypothetical protein
MGPVEGRRQVEISGFGAHQTHITVTADRHVDRAPAVAARAAVDAAAGTHTGVRLDPAPDPDGRGQSRAAQAGGHQHHPGAGGFSRPAAAQPYLPAARAGASHRGLGAPLPHRTFGHRRLPQGQVEAAPGEGVAQGQLQLRLMVLQAEAQSVEGHAAEVIHQVRQAGLSQRAEGQPVEAGAADLPAGKGAPLHQQHPQPLPGQLVGRQGTGGPGPEHDHIPLRSRHRGSTAPSGRRQLSRKRSGQWRWMRAPPRPARPARSRASSIRKAPCTETGPSK